MSTAPQVAAVHAPGRLPRWAPFLIIWAVWAFFQTLWSVPAWWWDIPRSGGRLLWAVPLLLLPFDAGLYGPAVFLLPLLTPVALVALDIAARPDWSPRGASVRYALFSVWFGLSFALAPNVGFGVVWSGGLGFGDLANMFLYGALGWCSAFIVATWIGWIVLRRVRNYTGETGPDTQLAAAQHADRADGR